MKKIFLFFIVNLLVWGCASTDQASTASKNREAQPIKVRYAEIINQAINNYEKISNQGNADIHTKNIAQAKADLLKNKKATIIHFLTTLNVNPERNDVEKAIKPFMEVVEENYIIEKRKK